MPSTIPRSTFPTCSCFKCYRILNPWRQRIFWPELSWVRVIIDRCEGLQTDPLFYRVTSDLSILNLITDETVSLIHTENVIHYWVGNQSYMSYFFKTGQLRDIRRQPLACGHGQTPPFKTTPQPHPVIQSLSHTKSAFVSKMFKAKCGHKTVF